MEITILPCKITIPSQFLENLEKPKFYSRISLPKLTNDACSKRLCNLGRLSEAISALDSCSSTVGHVTFSYLIESCTHSNSLELCYQIHALLKKLIKQPDLFLETKLVSMYAKCGSLNDAFAVFDEMPQRNLYTWSSIIGACSREKMWGDVVELFRLMMQEGDVIPDGMLLTKVLQACGNSGYVETGRLIHGIVIKCGMVNELRVNNSILSVYGKCERLSSAERFFEGMGVSDRVSWNAMLKGYCQKGKISEAHELFKMMREEEGVEPDIITWNLLISSYSQLGKCDDAMELMREMDMSGLKPDVFTWTSMISGFVYNNKGLEALRLFREMLLGGIEPNGITLVSVVSACTFVKDIRKGKEAHLVAIKLGYGEDVLVGNAVIDMYSKCGKLEAAREVFDMISKKDVYTWNTMIAGYCQAGYCGVAHDLFKQMQESDVLPNVVTWNVMMTGYIQRGDEDQAMDLFDMMEKNGGVKRDTASWNALIAGYLDHGHKDKALRIFRKMQSSGVKPNSVTILSILPATANLIAMKKVKEIHCSVLRRNLESQVSVANSLIDAYAKSGSINYSVAMFDGMPSMDIITWNALTTGYVLHGCFSEAIHLFECMRKQGCKPNRSTFASVILAYALAKKVDQGRKIFTIMTQEYQILPCLDHYIAMVNIYGRSGKLDEALDFIESIPVEPDVSIWSALLTACRRHGNVKLAIHAGERLLQLEPDNAFIRRLVSQLYDLCGNSKEGLKMKRPGTRKVLTGWSWIEEKHRVHVYENGSHLQVDGKCVDSWIESIDENAKELIYYDMVNMVEEESAGTHSEKLALAFGIIGCRGSVRIVKNLRMCEQCHRFAKVVSKRHKRRIYVSDSKCLHYFKDGKCSCGDYWPTRPMKLLSIIVARHASIQIGKMQLR